MMTLFIDIDGTLVKHKGTAQKTMDKVDISDTLPYVHKLINLVYDKGGKIILTTGRPESHREETIKNLLKCQISYDYLLMGLSNSLRFLVNDKKQNNTINSAYSINVDRNVGVKEVYELLEGMYK